VRLALTVIPFFAALNIGTAQNFFLSDPDVRDGIVTVLATSNPTCGSSQQFEATFSLEHWHPSVSQWIPEYGLDLSTANTMLIVSAIANPTAKIRNPTIRFSLNGHEYGGYRLKITNVISNCVDPVTPKFLYFNLGGYIPDNKPPEFTAVRGLMVEHGQFVSPTDVGQQTRMAGRYAVYLEQIGANPNLNYLVYQDQGNGEWVTQIAQPNVGGFSGLCTSAVILDFPSYITPGGIAEVRPVFVQVSDSSGQAIGQLLVENSFAPIFPNSCR
jgi:hypothetical protein